MQLIVLLFGGIGTFIQATWRIIIPGALGFGFAWWSVGQALSRCQTGYLDWCFQGLGLTPDLFRWGCAVVTAIVFIVGFNAAAGIPGGGGEPPARNANRWPL